MRVFVNLALLASAIVLAVVALCFAGCVSPPQAPAPEELLLAHKRACAAGGSAIALAGQMVHQACATTADELREFVATDPDCRAYFGDAGATVNASTLCESDAGH